MERNFIMKLYICGNGFDLNHGLPTSYNHYKKYLREKNPSLLQKYELFPYLNETEEQSRWSDIEAALCIDYKELFQTSLENYYPDLTSDTDSRWYDIEIDIEELTRFINDFTGRCFFEWLWVAEEKEAKAKFNFEKDSIFINFNYTSTIQRLYGVSDSSVFHIHGALHGLQGRDIMQRDYLPSVTTIEQAEVADIVEADKWNSGYIRNEIQFGATGITSEEASADLIRQYESDEFFGASLEAAINTLVDFIDKSTKNPKNNYERLSTFLEDKQIDEVVIMGVSLGEADEPYYTNIIVPLLKDKKWTFMLHGDDSNRIDNFISSHGIINFDIQPW